MRSQPATAHAHCLPAMLAIPSSSRRLGTLASHVAHSAESNTAKDELGVLGWPTLGLPAPEYRTDVPRFEPGSPQVNEHLQRYGFAVVKALTPTEVDQALSNVWDLIEGQGTGVDRHATSTWTNDRWSPSTAVKFAVDVNAIAGSGSGAGGHGMFQSQALWYIRSRPGLRKMWSGIYGTDELIVSFDGLNLVRPWKLDPTWRVTAQVNSYSLLCCADSAAKRIFRLQISWRMQSLHIDGVRQMTTPDGHAPDGGFDPDTRYYAQVWKIS